MSGNNGKTLGEYRGIPMHHWDDELPLIAEILGQAKPRITVEVGTMYGGFAAFLADTVSEWGGEVLTIDHILYDGIEQVCQGRRNLFFLRGDVFSPFVSSLVIRELHRRDSCLYCDGGAKREELPALGRYANIVGVHDYGTEVSPDDCAAWAKATRMEPIEEARFAAIQDAHGGYFVSRFWRQA